MKIKEIINDILKEIKPTKSLDNVTDIIESGYLDSFEVMALIAKLSEVFNIQITVNEIVPENFNSIDAIAAMIKALKA